MFRIEHKNRRRKGAALAARLRLWSSCADERGLQLAAMPYRSILSLSERRVIWSCAAARV